MDYVIIDPECFFAMIFSSIEVYNRETMGFLMGNRRRRMIHGKMETAVACEIAYPLQTARRKPTSVTKGNIRAFERIRALFPSLGLYLVGEYHSHPNLSSELTKDDIDYIEEQMELVSENGEGMENDNWLELVISIKKKRYINRQKVEWTWSDYAKKARCVIKISPHIGYDLTIGGYRVFNDNNRIRSQEIIVFIPWVTGYWA